MPLRLKPFVDFISDYHLVNEEGIIVFNATLNYFVGDNIVSLKSEVQIVTSIPNSFCTMYLMHSDERTKELPSMFQSDKAFFEYIPHKFMQVEVTDNADKRVVVNIVPDTVNTAL